MSGFEINLGGKKYTIKEGDSVKELINKPELKTLAPLFDLVDNSGSAMGGDGVLDASEISLLQKALSGVKGDIKNYDVDKLCDEYFSSGKNAQEYFEETKIEKKENPKKASSKAFNQYIQTLAKKYDKESITTQLSGNIQEVNTGDTLYSIAKAALEAEGKTPTSKEINERMAQIALVNNINDVNNVRVKTKLKVGASPTAGGATPPTAGGANPPAAGGANPPAAGEGTTPPAAGGATPPTAGGANPPAAGGANPPTAGGANPPAAGGANPPTAGGATPPAAGGANPPAAVGATPPTAVGATPPAAGEGTTPPAAGAGAKPTPVEKGELAKTIADKTSSITVSENGLKMGSGMPVDKDGNELKDANGKRNFKDPKYKAGGYVMKYTSGETVMYQITRKKDDGKLGSEVKLSASSIEELKELDKKFHDTALKVKPPVENETEEQAKARKAENLAALKELVTLTNGNIQVIRNVAAKLRDDDYVDRTSDEYKAFVQDLLLTRNADVINALFKDADGNKTATVLEKDKTAHEILAGMYQEIRAKEKAGEKLSDEEIELKSSLRALRGYNGYQVDADTENGVHEKYMSYDNMDGTPMYQVYIDGNWYLAKDPKLLDEFLTKLESADTDEKKSALFKEYINTQDSELAKCLARNVKTLKAKDEDIISLVKANGMEVLATLPSPDGDNRTYSEEVIDAVISRAKEIVTTDRGNLENAVGLYNIRFWIYSSGKTDEEQDKIRTEILETYFEVTQDEEGNKTYTFNPSRRPTYEEMSDLTDLVFDVSNGSDSFKGAPVKYTKLEDMGKGQYNEVIETIYGGTYTVPHYAEMVEKMSTPEEVIDFIDNKVTTDHHLHLPFDKIIEKFPDDKEIADKLLMNIDGFSKISEESKQKLFKNYMKIDGDKVTFDKSKLPSVRNFIDYLLPKDCKEGDSAKYFEAMLETMNPEDNNDDFLSLMNNHKYSEAAGNTISQKVEKYLRETGTPGTNTYNRLATYAFNTGMLSDESKAIVYEKSTSRVKQDLINGGYNRQGSLVVVKQGDSIDKIVKEYLANHLDKFPKLKESVESNKEKWTPERINEALNDYMNDFRTEILKDLGISDPTKVKSGDIIDLGKVRWDEHQPG